MHLNSPESAKRQHGSALVVVLIMTSLAIALLVAMLSWSKTNLTMTSRNNQYVRTGTAAESAVEKVISRVGNDYQNYGIDLVTANLGSYRATVPTSSEYPTWANYQFQNEAGVANNTTVDFLPVSTSTVLSMKYAGLRGFAYDVRIVSKARESSSQYPIIARNEQHLQLSLVPIFQYAIFYDRDLEFNRCAPMKISGPVHCNASIYGAPATSLDFYGQVTAGGKILIKQKKPGDNQTIGSGTTVFHSDKKEGVPTLNLPLGTTNTPTAIHQLIEVPPWTESPSSLMGQIRYYNKADMVILVKDNGITVTSGSFNNFATSIPWQQASNFVRTNVMFYDERENKNVRTTQLDIDKLRRWNWTNQTFQYILAQRDVRLVYVSDTRTTSSSIMTGVRLVNGACLPPKGLTVATSNPLYVWGNYNVCTNASYSGTVNAVPVNLGTADTKKTWPASVAADCVTILSVDWNDSSAAGSVSGRQANDTTMNMAILAGNTETVSSFGGGVHNLPRYLEDWTSETFTLNTSIVSMFPSQKSTGGFIAPGSSGEYYTAPNRNWSFDTNFNDPTKLPPGTPQIRLLVRGSWDD